MKRIIIIISVLIISMSLMGCEKKAPDSFSSAVDVEIDESKVMSYEEYITADLETLVTIDTYLQAKQELINGRTSLYTQDEEGAYFIYNMKCTKDEYEKLQEGQRIIVAGFKNSWSGEVEIWNAKIQLADGTFIAEPLEVNNLLDDEDIIEYQNQKIKITEMVIEPSKDASGNERAFIYGWDGSGKEGDDIYFNASIYGHTFSFTVETALCNEDSEVYKKAQELEIGDVVNMEGFLYWFEGVNPHLTGIEIKK